MKREASITLTSGDALLIANALNGQAQHFTALPDQHPGASDQTKLVWAKAAEDLTSLRRRVMAAFD